MTELEQKRDAVKKMLMHRQNCLCVSIDLANDTRFSTERFYPLDWNFAEWGREYAHPTSKSEEILTIIFTSSISDKWLDVGNVMELGKIAIHVLFIRSLVLDRYSISIGNIEVFSDDYYIKQLCDGLSIRNIIACDFYNYRRDTFHHSLGQMKMCGIPVSVAVFKGLNAHAVTDVDNEDSAAKRECEAYNEKGYKSKVLDKEMTLNDFKILQYSTKNYMESNCKKIRREIEDVLFFFVRNIGDKTLWEMTSSYSCCESVRGNKLITPEIIKTAIQNDLDRIQELLNRLIPEWSSWLNKQLSGYSFPLANNKKWDALFGEVILNEFPKYINENCQRILDLLNKHKYQAL